MFQGFLLASDGLKQKEDFSPVLECFTTCLCAHLKQRQLVLAIPCAKWSFRILRVARASSSKANLQVLLDTRRIRLNRLWCIRYIYVSISIVANSSILWCCSVWPWPGTPPVQEPLDWPRNCRTRQQMAANTTHNSIIPFFVVYILYYICIYICILYCVWAVNVAGLWGILVLGFLPRSHLLSCLAKCRITCQYFTRPQMILVFPFSGTLLFLYF